METTSGKLENVCQHGFWIGQGAAPCPFCHPECYANGTHGTIAPLITVNLNTLLDLDKDARIAALESALAAAREENERLKTLASDEANDTDELRDAIDEFLPDYVLDDGTNEPANHVETIEYAGDEIRRLTRELAALRDDPGRVREPVRWFAEQMERKLKANDHKSHWSGCDPVWLFERLEEEATELFAAFRPTRPVGCFADTPKDAEKIISEAADVANFAMMIADKARAVLDAADGRGEQYENV